MGKRSSKQKLYVTATTGLSQSLYKRHLAALGLTDTAAYRTWCQEHGFGQGRNKSWKRRQKERRCAQKVAQREELLCVLNCHIRDLGMGTVGEYEDWCHARRINDTGNKSASRRRQEAAIAQNEQADATLRIPRPEQRGFDCWLTAIFEDTVEPNLLPTPILQLIYSVVRTENTLRARKILHHFFSVVGAKSRLLQTEGGLPLLSEDWRNTYVYALCALARHHSQWLRRVDDWKVKGHTCRAQFHSLARHLLAEYDVPAFMDRAWFEAEREPAEGHQQWFIAIGKGSSVRSLDLPIELTRQSARYFLKAPADYSFEAAMRWGQARGAGGSEKLARAVASSLLRDIQADEPFWNEVVLWFVNHPELATQQVGPIADYLFNVKFMPRAEWLPNGALEEMPPPEPDFTMKGRTPAALLRKMEEWHLALARENKRPARVWNPLEVEAFAMEQASPEQDAIWQWTIRELVSDQELTDEGRAMSNCVASYVDSCVAGKSSIWSLRLETPEWPEARRIMTIEVDPETKTIVQARGKCNVVPGSKACPKRLKLAPNLLRQWAAFRPAPRPRCVVNALDRINRIILEVFRIRRMRSRRTTRIPDYTEL